MAEALWSSIPPHTPHYWVSGGPLKIERGLFHWKVVQKYYYNREETRLVVFRSFTKKRATAALVLAALKGYEVIYD